MQHPLTPPLNELIQHHRHIRKHKATDIEPEELSRMACREFESDVRRGGVLEAWVFDLARDLVCRYR